VAFEGVQAEVGEALGLASARMDFLLGFASSLRSNDHML
jgi:hypothetical protein